MQSDDVYRVLGKSLIDEFEDDLAVFIGKAMNDYLYSAQESGNKIDIIKVITNFVNKKLFYVDVEDIPRETIEKYVNEAIKNYRNEQAFQNTLKTAVDKTVNTETFDIFGKLHSELPTFKEMKQDYQPSIFSTTHYDIHSVLGDYKKNHTVKQDEKVQQFVETAWTNPRLDPGFKDLPKLGDDVITYDLMANAYSTQKKDDVDNNPVEKNNQIDGNQNPNVDF